MMTKKNKNIRKKSVIKAFFFIAISVLFSCEEDIDAGTGTITIVPEPIAAFTETVDAVDWKIYSFTDRSTNATTYSWEFGDGNTSNEAEPTNTYVDAGTYTVSLTVGSDSDITDAIEKTIIVINPFAPIVAFTATEDSSDWKTFTFTNGTSKATTYVWDFGDGTTSTDIEPTKTYSGEDEYTDTADFTVILTATNGNTGFSTTLEKTITLVNPDPVALPTKTVIVLNGTFDEYTANTGDNADGWDMTPNSTVVDNNGDTIDSPYNWSSDATKALDSWVETKYGDDSEQPSSTGDGNKFPGLGDRGVKLNEGGRRLYQEVAVEKNVVYTFTIDSRSEVAGINTEVYILNNIAMISEDGLDANGAEDTSVDEYFLIDNDFNSSKSSSISDTFTTNTFTFKPTTDKIVIYVRSIGAIDSNTEVFFDNVDIITPTF